MPAVLNSETSIPTKGISKLHLHTMERLVYFTNTCGLLAGAHAACSQMEARDDQRRAGQRGAAARSGRRCSGVP